MSGLPPHKPTDWPSRTQLVDKGPYQSGSLRGDEKKIALVSSLRVRPITGKCLGTARHGSQKFAAVSHKIGIGLQFFILPIGIPFQHRIALSPFIGVVTESY